MEKVTALRLPKDIKAVIEERVKEERLDRSSVMRQFLAIGVREYKKQKAVELYKAEKVSLSKAAEIAGMNVYDMIDLLIKSGVRSDYTIEDMKRERKLIEKMLKKGKSRKRLML